MTYKEIRQSAIPCLSFMKNTDGIMYVGPKLDRMQLRMLQAGTGSSFIYLPDVVEDMSKEAFEYNFPGVGWPVDISVDKIYAQIRAELAASREASQQYLPEDMLLLWFEGDSLVVCDVKEEFGALVNSLVNRCGRMLRGESLASCYMGPTGLESGLMGTGFIPETQSHNECSYEYAPLCEEHTESADTNFDEQMEEAADEVREAIKRLLLKGFSASVIRSWLEEDVKLSRLRITRRFNILLVDYDKEVKMGPLPKTVFLFFLRHPEGIMFSHLMDYADELLHIYSQVCRNDDPEKMHESVGRLTDPFDNSINEKCAAVKKAFMMQIEDSIARNYYICGQQGFKKGISLDRSLVEWECEL